jgi:hypothetical protein
VARQVRQGGVRLGLVWHGKARQVRHSMAGWGKVGNILICEACYKWIPDHEVGGKSVRIRPHEIKSRGAGGKCVVDNQLQLCVDCHRLYHQKGFRHFVRVYPHLKERVEKALGRD